MKTIIENIKLRPQRFILEVIVSILILCVLLIVFRLNTFNQMTMIIFLVIIFINFSMFVSSERLSRELNQLIKEKYLTREQLFEITGLTQYEVTEENGKFVFYMTPVKKKRYKKVIERYNR